VNSKPHIFLDIDGVLSLDFDEYTYSNQKKWNPKVMRCNFNKKAVKVLNDICEAVDPIIILSSDWQDHYDIDVMNEFFEWNGINYKISAYTPSAWGVMFTSYQQLEECRAYEILQYVREREVKNWVAIDDLDLKTWIPDNFAHTPKSNEGLKQSGVKSKILNILLN
jgi:hypothetical protein